MKTYRKAIFAVVYTIDEGKVEYLILKRKKHWKGWEFTKGGVEKGEKLIETVWREIKEETGQRVIDIKKWKTGGKYKYGKDFVQKAKHIGQEWTLFSVRVAKGKVNLDREEHNGFKWLDFKNAEKILTWKNQKKCLKMVNSSLENGVH